MMVCSLMYCSDVGMLWHVKKGNSWDVRAATWNVSSVVGLSGEVVDVLHIRTIDLWCAQETRWKGGSAMMLGVIGRGYTLF